MAETGARVAAAAELAAGGAVIGAAALGGRRYSPSPDHPEIAAWYRALDKPAVTPPDPVFGGAWGLLYPAIAYSGWRVWRAGRSPERSRALAWWGAQMALNAAWTPLFFGARRPRAAFGELLALVAATVGYAAAARRVDRTAARLTVPYLAWLAFAAYLNGEIARRNG